MFSILNALEFHVPVKVSCLNSRAFEIMTNPPRSRVCDFCKKEIPAGEMSYKVQFNQNPPFDGTSKNEFVSSNNKADLCKTDFLVFCEGDFTVKWKTMISTDGRKTWHEKKENPQEQLA